MLTVIILHIMFNVDMDEEEYDLRSGKQKEKAEIKINKSYTLY